MKMAFYSTYGFEKEFLTQNNANNVAISFFETSLNNQTAVLSKDFDAVCVFVNDDCSAAILEQLKLNGVKYILLRSAGFNHIDLPKAKELGFKVANVPSYSPYAVAEHTITLLLALNRKIIRAHDRVRDLNFSLNGLVGFDLHGKTVGLIGLGKIGEKVARILNGFGCKLLVVDPNENIQLQKELNLRYVDLDTLCKESDIISLHAPLNEQTKYIIDTPQIEFMKKGVMILNTSRGGLLNTKAVINGLKNQKIGYLGLDVYEEEKGLFFEDHSSEILQDDTIARLLTFNNVIITSHQGFLTETALTNISNTVYFNLENMINNDIFENQLV